MRRTLTFTLDFIPTSSKNRSQIRRRGARRWIAKSDEAETHQARIGAACREAMGKLGASWAGDHYVSVDIEVDADESTTTITVTDEGPQPTKGKRRTKRDVHGVTETVMDGLNGHAYDDDRQARRTETKWRGW